MFLLRVKALQCQTGQRERRWSINQSIKTHLYSAAIGPMSRTNQRRTNLIIKM